MEERPGGVTGKGKPMMVRGSLLKANDPAPDFSVIANDLSSVSLSDSSGKVRLLSVVPALETRLCDAQTRRFNEEATRFSDEVLIWTISADPPALQKEWCLSAGVEQVQTLSCQDDMNFADAYGVHVVAIGRCQRSIFIVDQDDVVRYVEYVPEIGQEVNFEAALAALKTVTGG